jgi:uncharacterized membrane protein YfcA
LWLANDLRGLGQTDGQSGFERKVLFYLVVAMGVVIGAIMGLTGAGGGILAVPVLVGTLGWTMQKAAPVALIAVASGAAVGAMDGFRLGLVRYKAATLMALCGIPMTRIGQGWAHELPHDWLLGGFGLLMLLISVRFLKMSNVTYAEQNPNSLRLARINGETGKFIWTPLTALVLAAVGSLTGMMTGLLGVGGGFLIVPLMRRFTELSMQGIVATSLFVITLVSGGGVINALASGAQVPMMETIGFVAAMVSGMLVGRKVTRRLQPHHIQTGFGLLLIAVGCFMLWKAWHE